MAKNKVTIQDEKPLTDKQENYCQKYVECANKSEAYRFAYNAENMKPETIRVAAFELHRNPNITIRIETLRKELYEGLNLNAYKIAKGFSEIYDRGMQVEAVKDQDGNEIGEFKSDLTNAVKANIELGKHIGFYEKDNTQKGTTVEFYLPDNGREVKEDN